MSVPPTSSAPREHEEKAASCTIGIEGMHCASCQSRVERALRGLAGVVEASVNLAHERASVSYHPERIPLRDIVAAVRETGYTPSVAETDLAVEGMSCASCVSRVQRVLENCPGVVEARVNLATARAHVAYLPTEGTPETLISAVRRAGYDAHETVQAPPPPAKAGGLGRDVVRASVLAIAVLFLAMGREFVPPLAHVLGTIRPFPHAGGWLEMILATLAILGPGRRFFRPGLIAYRHLSPDMNALVATGTGAAWLYSALVLVDPGLFPAGARGLYFDSTAVVIAAVLLGRYLEEIGKNRATGAMRALAALKVPSARRIRPDGQEEEVAVEALATGDRIAVRPGERVPVDGLILEGATHIDESMLTGEPLPAARGPGGAVVGGTINLEGRLLVEATATGEGTVLARIVRTVANAQAAKLPIQRLADRVVTVFTTFVLATAVVTFVLWMTFTGEPASALTAAVAVLVVACPCALGLATPAAIAVATGRAAELGVLFRKGEALETLARARVILFDKTGTLTLGRPRLVAIRGADPDRALAIAAALENRSEHPLAASIVETARERKVDLPEVGSFRALPGLGVEGEIGGRRILAGNARLMAREGIALPTERELLGDESGVTPVYTAEDGRLVGVLLLADRPRPEAAQVVSLLRKRGYRVAMVTGDTRANAEALAGRLGIADVRAEVLPDGKASVVEAFRRNEAPVVFVGDGINDAPALARADVGIAIAGGTDLALETADVTLMRGRIGDLPTALETARRTLANIRGNLFWAFFYNILLIPIAAGAAAPFGVQLNPMLAGIAMGTSSLFVLGNSLRLRRLKGFAPQAGEPGSRKDPLPDGKVYASTTFGTRVE